MKNILVISIIGLVLFGCGERREHKEARQKLSAVIKQVDAAYMNIEDNYTKKGFVQADSTDYMNDFEGIRKEIAEVPGIDKFQPLRDSLHKITGYAIDLVRKKAKIAKHLEKAMEANKSYNDIMEKSVKAAENYSASQESRFKRKVNKYSKKAVKDSIDFYNSKEAVAENVQLKQNIIQRLKNCGRRINKLAKREAVTDTLRFFSNLPYKNKEITSSIEELSEIEVKPITKIRSLSN